MRSWTVPLVAGLIAFAIYLATLAPDLTWAHAGTDGGDLVTAAAVWGVPHPPGYPTYTFIGHIFASFPFGSVAYNLNLMSALAAALACAMLAAAILKINGSAFVAAITSLTYAFSLMLWGQATIAEVHALNALFVAALAYITLPWIDRDAPLRPRACAALGLLWGLGLGNSTTLLAFAPIVIPALWRARQYRWIGFVCFALGLAVYLLIPIRANTLPPINWGDARTIPDFLWLVSGGLYRGYAFAAAPQLIAQRVISLPRLALEQLGWIGAIWIAWLFMRPLRFRVKRSLLIVALLYIIFATTYNTIDSDLYLIPVWLLLCGYVAIGLHQALSTQRDSMRRVALGLIALLGPGILLLSGWSSHDLSHDRSVAEFADQVLTTLPADAILITRADAHTFALWYHVQVLQQRRDVSIVDARLISYEWYEPMLIAQGAAPALPESRAGNEWLDQLAAANPLRPICDLQPEPRTMACQPPQTPDP